jgi:DNA-binding XRE family transcriptional regulator
VLEQARLDAGLTQAELAAAAGVSRQAVGAIEAGRHRPGVDAALALARVVGVPVEALFGAAAEAWPIGGAGEGDPVLAARVGERVVCAPLTRALAVEGWPRADGVLEGGRVRPLPGVDLEGLVAIGCDPALALAAGLLPASGPRRVLAISGSSMSAVEALRDGRAHAALVHGRRLGRAPLGAQRVPVARWRVGVAQRGRAVRPVAELCERRVHVVQREAGAASQQAFLAAVARAGASPPPGPRADGHLEVSRRVAAGAPAGITMEPAALALGLGFEPLEEHRCELWIAAAHADHPGAQALAGLLRSAPFTRRLALLPGYEVVA